ncbi:hypothetical protein BY458DRAFT_498772 [Sporodiniella umbellata]|nr:hypothetical protein BY458DRAFT_498772 [Sporodiniella umbellata]
MFRLQSVLYMEHVYFTNQPMNIFYSTSVAEEEERTIPPVQSRKEVKEISNQEPIQDQEVLDDEHVEEVLLGQALTQSPKETDSVHLERMDDLIEASSLLEASEPSLHLESASLERSLSDASSRADTPPLETPETQETLDDPNSVLDQEIKTPPLSLSEPLPPVVVEEDKATSSMLDEIVFSPLVIPPLDEYTFQSNYSLLDDVDISPPASPSNNQLVRDPKRRRSLFFMKPEADFFRSKHRPTELLPPDQTKALQGLARQSSRFRTKGKDLSKRVRKALSFHQ